LSMPGWSDSRKFRDRQRMVIVAMHQVDLHQGRKWAAVVTVKVNLTTMRGIHV